MFPTRTLTAALVCLAAFAIHVAPASAQTVTADEKELAAYTLTMPTVKKAAAVMIALAEEQAKDPRAKEIEKIKAERKTLEEKEELTEAEQAKLEKLREREETLQNELEESFIDAGNGNKTLSEMEATIKRHPAAVRILAREGLTARELVVSMMALLQAALAEGFSQGKLDLAKLPPGINPANIKFVRENKAELEAMQKAMAGKPKG